MFEKIQKIAAYLRNYKQNRDLLRMYNEGITFPLYARDYRSSLKFSNRVTKSSEQILSRIIILVHSLEKGLATSEEFRLGFGQPKVLEVARLCNAYMDKQSDMPFRLCYAVGVLQEYKRLHDMAKFALNPETIVAIDLLIARVGEDIVGTQTQTVEKDRYFAKSQSSFEEFAKSRHSVRDFSGDSVPEEKLQEALALAQQAPSACNRQSVRVYAVYDEAKKRRLVEMQNNQRGFADNASPVLVVAFERQDWEEGEQWFGGYVDAGIYMMNLLYALHYHQIAAIPLNWYATIEKTDELKAMIGMPESQIPVAVVACGYPKSDFKLVTSKRLPEEDVLKVI